MANGSILTTALQPVQPGDLIEADLFNKLIGAVRELDEQISKLRVECRKSPGAEIRPIVIKTAVLKLETPLIFTVTGSGLDPTDLEERFIITSGLVEKSFAHEKLKGTDTKIVFTADPEQFAEGASAEVVTRTMRAVETQVSLTISAKRGVSATHALEVERG